MASWLSPTFLCFFPLLFREQKSRGIWLCILTLPTALRIGSVPGWLAPLLPHPVDQPPLMLHMCEMSSICLARCSLSNYAGLVPPHSCANVQYRATMRTPYDNKVSGTDPRPNPVSTSQSTRIRGVHHQIWLMPCSGPIPQVSSVLREHPVVNSIASLFLFTGELYEDWNCFCLHQKHTHSWATHNSRDREAWNQRCRSHRLHSGSLAEITQMFFTLRTYCPSAGVCGDFLTMKMCCWLVDSL